MMWCICACDSVSKAVPLGTYWRISPLVFSLSPRSQA